MAASHLSVTPLSGEEITPFIRSVAELRIRVFREYPYLYDGDAEYEERYLRKYAASPDALVVVAMDDDRIVGASTALPLSDADEEFRAPFEASEYDARDVFYFGESLLDRPYRGRGIGHRFFDEREAFAASRGYGVTAFCAVVRPERHPRRPSGHRPHDAFWTKRGYVRRPDLVAHYAWKDLDDGGETEKPLVFWLRDTRTSTSA